MIIAVSGTPGTGKTSVSTQLAKMLGYEYISLNDFSRAAGFVLERDEDRDSDVIDIEKVKEIQLNDNVVVDGHFSHYVQSDVAFVLRTEPNALKERLVKKGWNARKIGENFEAEVMGVCSVESRELNETTIDFDTTDMESEKVAEIMANIVRSKKFKQDPIDWKIENYV